MFQSEVINKLSLECCIALGDFYGYKTIRTYIQMALVVGIEHFSTKMEEVVAMDKNGVECGRYKNEYEAARELGLAYQNISAVLHGRQHTCGGYIFMKTKDYELVKREPPPEDAVLIVPLK